MLSMGISVSKEQKALYNAGLAALGVWKQTKPRFFEDNVIAILASNLKLLCPQQPKKAIIMLLEVTYQKSPQILMGTLFSKHLTPKLGNLVRIKKFLVRYLYTLTNK
jgi:hypothetical protein